MTTLRRIIQISKEGVDEPDAETAEKTHRSVVETLFVSEEPRPYSGKKRGRKKKNHSLTQSLASLESLPSLPTSELSQNTELPRPKRPRGRPRIHHPEVSPAQEPRPKRGRRKKSSQEVSLPNSTSTSSIFPQIVNQLKNSPNPVMDFVRMSSSTSLASLNTKPKKKPGRKPSAKKNAQNITQPILQIPLTVESKEWVQCEDCTRWYELPQQVSSAGLPKHWFCKFITWNNLSAEENSAECEKRVQNPSNGANEEQIQEGAILGPTKEEKWVECDLCKQWRRMPDELDLDKLPKKWFCTMNVYDHRFNECAKPQEDYKPASYQNYTYNVSNTAQAVPLSGGARKQGMKSFKTSKKRQLERMCVYGVEEKSLRKNRKNPQTFKELIWWHFNDFDSQKFESFRKDMISVRYTGLSSFAEGNKRKADELRYSTQMSEILMGKKLDIGSQCQTRMLQQKLSSLESISCAEKLVHTELSESHVSKLITLLHDAEQIQAAETV